MYINIEFEINTDVYGEQRTYKLYMGKNEKEEEVIKDTEATLKKGTYYLQKDLSKVNTFLKNFFDAKIQKSSTKKDEKGKYIEYTETISAGSEFKTRIFKCTGVGYNKNDGRINYMKFEEQDTANL